MKTARDIWLAAARSGARCGATAAGRPDHGARGVPEGGALLRPRARPRARRRGRRGRRAAAIAERLGDDVALVVVSAPSYPFAALDPVAEVAAALPRARDPAARRRLHRRAGAAVLARDLPAWDFARARRHERQRRPAQVRLRAQGRLGAAAARARPAARAVLRDDALAGVPGGEPDDPRVEVGGTAGGGLGDHRGARASPGSPSSRRRACGRRRRCARRWTASGSARRRRRRSGRCSRSRRTTSVPADRAGRPAPLGGRARAHGLGAAAAAVG